MLSLVKPLAADEWICIPVLPLSLTSPILCGNAKTSGQRRVKQKVMVDMCVWKR
jgi:hypothetical protein